MLWNMDLLRFFTIHWLQGYFDQAALIQGQPLYMVDLSHWEHPNDWWSVMSGHCRSSRRVIYIRDQVALPGVIHGTIVYCRWSDLEGASKSYHVHYLGRPINLLGYIYGYHTLLRRPWSYTNFRLSDLHLGYSPGYILPTIRCIYYVLYIVCVVWYPFRIWWQAKFAYAWI